MYGKEYSIIKSVISQTWWVFLVYLLFLIISLTGNYSNGTTLVLTSIDISETILPARYRSEGYFYLFDDLFSYFWIAISIGWIYQLCQVVARSYWVKNVLWLKLAGVTDFQINISRLKTIAIFSVIILIFSTTWILIYMMAHSIYDHRFIFMAFSTSIHMVASGSLVCMYCERLRPSKIPTTTIIILCAFFPCILGITLSSVAESLGGWLPFAIMKMGQVREYPFERPLIALLGICVFYWSIKIWKSQRKDLLSSHNK